MEIVDLQGILFKNNTLIITNKIIKVVPEDYNDPDLEIYNPYVISLTDNNNIKISPYLNEYTDQIIFSFRSDDILTLFSPKESLILEYKKNILDEEQLEIQFNNSGGKED